MSYAHVGTYNNNMANKKPFVANKNHFYIFVDEVTTALSVNNTNFEEIKANAQERIRRFIKRENGREPMIIPIIVTR